VGFISQSAWACLEKDDNLVEAIQANKNAYAKTLKVAWGAQDWNWNPISTTKPKKWVQYPTSMNPKSFMKNMFPYLNYFFYIVCIF